MPTINNTNTRVTIQKVKENDMLAPPSSDCIRYYEYNLQSLKIKRKCDMLHRQF